MMKQKKNEPLIFVIIRVVEYNMMKQKTGPLISTAATLQMAISMHDSLEITFPDVQSSIQLCNFIEH